MDFSSLLGRQSILQQALGSSVKKSAAQVTPKAKKKADAAKAPAMEVPSWLTDISSILSAIGTQGTTINMPNVPVPDPLASLSVSSGEERKLRRKKSGILSAFGAGETGGFGA